MLNFSVKIRTWWCLWEEKVINMAKTKRKFTQAEKVFYIFELVERDTRRQLKEEDLVKIVFILILRKRRAN